jgi:endonuclease YncB( thermonuclease family)
MFLYLNIKHKLKKIEIDFNFCLIIKMGNRNSTPKIVPVDLYTSRGEIINLKGHIITIPEGSWYNLGTSRVNKNRPANVLFDERFHVFGTQNDLEGFYFRNHIIENQVCKIGTPTVAFAPNTNDIEKVPETLIDNLCTFNLIGLRTKGKVTNVVDGDTIDICFYVKLSFLYNPRPNFHESEGKKQQNTLVSSIKPQSPKIADSGLFLKMRARLNGIDAAEHNVSQGVLATQMMAQLYAKTNNIVYVDCNEFDKFGRILVDLYADQEYKQYLNYYLIDHPDPKLGVLAEYYGGKTKSDYMKTLPTI